MIAIIDWKSQTLIVTVNNSVEWGHWVLMNIHDELQRLWQILSDTDDDNELRTTGTVCTETVNPLDYSHSTQTIMILYHTLSLN